MIRVSVVATGIDQALAQRPGLSGLSESRLADIGPRLRAEKHRDAERVERLESARGTAASPANAAAGSLNASIESAAKAAIAAAVEDVTIRPLAPKPSLFIDPTANEPEAVEETAFIPPQPERMPMRAPRMPRIDELPLPAQNEIRARRGELADDHHPEKRQRSLLQRLAAVGLGRREENAKSPPGPRAAPVAPMSGAERLPGRPMPRPAEPRPEPVSEYAKRAMPQGLDHHGRASAVHNSGEVDQLDIPAFLRRQAN
jgi:cell division protein FtsZ